MFLKSWHGNFSVLPFPHSMMANMSLIALLYIFLSLCHVPKQQQQSKNKAKQK